MMGHGSCLQSKEVANGRYTGAVAVSQGCGSHVTEAVWDAWLVVVNSYSWLPWQQRVHACVLLLSAQQQM